MNKNDAVNSNGAYLIPNFLHIRIILNDYRVFHIAARRCWSAKLLTIVICRTAHTAAVQENFKCRAQMSTARFHMHTMSIAVISFREDHAIERSIKFNVHTHVRFLALNL